MALFTDNVLSPGVVERAQAGDVDAQEAVFRAYEVPVRTLARRLVPIRATAEELAQDVFVDVLTKLDRYDRRGSFAGWMRALTVNRCLMYLRSPWRRGLRWLDSTDTEDAGPPGDADGALLDVERALAGLTDVARAVVWLHDVEGYTHAEIGALFGASASFSKSQLARAHERLREMLEPEGVTATCTPEPTSC